MIKLITTMKLNAIKYTLELKHQFSISYSSRKTTPVVLVKIDDGEYTGFGEASLPPYLEETQDSVIDFLTKIKFKNISSTSELIDFMNSINETYHGNYSAKGALNIAMNDLLGKKLGKPCFEIYNIQRNEQPMFTSFTIGIDSNEKLRKKILEAEEFNILKIKLGTDRDKEIIETIRNVTPKPLYVDANQGWKDKHYAREMCEWLKEQNVKLIEQPMPVGMIAETAWLKENLSIPIIADEAVQKLEDIDRIKHAYHGINIKLMKCGGINSAMKMIEQAKKCGLKIMLGCMTETSCAISAAVQLSPLADFLDLDGNMLIDNDPFEARTVDDGKIILSNSSGLGIKLKQNLFV